MTQFTIADLRSSTVLVELNAAEQQWIMGGLPFSIGISIVDVKQQIANLNATVANSVVEGGINQIVNF